VYCCEAENPVCCEDPSRPNGGYCCWDYGTCQPDDDCCPCGGTCCEGGAWCCSDPAYPHCCPAASSCCAATHPVCCDHGLGCCDLANPICCGTDWCCPVDDPACCVGKMLSGGGKGTGVPKVGVPIGKRLKKADMKSRHHGRPGIPGKPGVRHDEETSQHVEE
jgi:hypothetical protein